MAGKLEFIRKDTASSVTFLKMENVFSADYDVYAFVLEKFDVASPGAPFLRYRYIDSANSTIADAEYDYAGTRLNGAAAFSDGSGTNNTYQTGLSSSTGDLTSEGGNAITYVYQPYNSNRYTFSLGTSVNANGVSSLQGFKYINVHKVQEQITGITIISDPGRTFETIEVSVYGVK